MRQGCGLLLLLMGLMACAIGIGAPPLSGIQRVEVLAGGLGLLWFGIRLGYLASRLRVAGQGQTNPRLRLIDWVMGAVVLGAIMATTLTYLGGSGTRADDNAWAEAERADREALEYDKRNLAGYGSYLQQFPEGKHAEQAFVLLIEALGDFRPPPPGSPPGTKPGGSWSAAGQALVQVGAPAVPPLIQGLKDPDNLVRRYAAETLGALKEVAVPAIPQLVEALAADSAPDVREDCAWALAEIGPGRPEVIAALEKASQTDSEAFVRSLAADHLKRARR